VLLCQQRPLQQAAAGRGNAAAAGVKGSAVMRQQALYAVGFGLFCNRQLLVALENCAMYCH
jgi:hypothetical protein